MLDKERIRNGLTIIIISFVGLMLAVIIYLVGVNVWKHLSEVTLIAISMTCGFLVIWIAFLTGRVKTLKQDIREERTNSREATQLVMRMAQKAEKAIDMTLKKAAMDVESRDMVIERQRTLHRALTQGNAANGDQIKPSKDEDHLSDEEAQKLTMKQWKNK